LGVPWAGADENTSLAAASFTDPADIPPPRYRCVPLTDRRGHRLRACYLEKLEPEQEITIGDDTWVVFPWLRKLAMSSVDQCAAGQRQLWLGREEVLMAIILTTQSSTGPNWRSGNLAIPRAHSSQFAAQLHGWVSWGRQSRPSWNPNSDPAGPQQRTSFDDWYYQIHVLPLRIDLGNLVTNQVRYVQVERVPPAADPGLGDP
jgi:hypothetical protein